AVLLQVGLGGGVELLLGVGDPLVALQVLGPAGAGVLPVQVDLLVLQRAAQDVGAHQPGHVLGLGAGGAQRVDGDLAQDDALGELLGGDPERRAGQVHVGGERAAGQVDVGGLRQRLGRVRPAAAAGEQRSAQRQGGRADRGPGGTAPRGARFGGCHGGSSQIPRGRSTSSTMPASQSTARASTATRTLPVTSTTVRLEEIPLEMTSPRPPAPMKVASATVPTVSTRAVRMPASITGTASGSSTRHSTWARPSPMPRAGSITARSTWSRPTMVLRSTGRIPYSTIAVIAMVWMPQDTKATANSTIRPMVGTACPTLATASTGPENRRAPGRVSATPSGTAMARISTTTTRLRPRCCQVRLSRYSAFRLRRSIRSRSWAPT